MVYFSCGACGEPLKKPQVEKHLFKCRGCVTLSCLDCMKDFHGDEYKTHNQCMSEAQRYSKDGRNGWDPSQGQGNKGEIKQMMWMDNLKTLVENTTLESDVKTIVETILHHENIPRKKPKFINFIKNIMRNKAKPHSIDKTWDLFSQAMKPAAPEQEKTPPPEPVQVKEEVEETSETSKEKKSKKKKNKKNKEVEEEDAPMADEEKPKKKKKHSKEKDKENVEGEMEVEVEEPTGKKKKKKKGLKDQENGEESVDSDGPSTKKSKKRKLDDSAMDVNETAEPDAKKSKFDWDDVITSLLEKQSDKEMSMKKLKKRCIAEYMFQHEGTHKTKEDLAVKFNKKLKKRKYKVLKDRVTLKTDSEDETEEKMQVDEKKPIATCEEKPVVAPPVQKEKSNLSFNKWEATNFGSSAQNDKFRRLMGIKSAPPPEAVKVDNKRDDKKMFAVLEDNFEKARQMRQSGQGMGLGFAGTCQTGSYV